MEFVFQNAPGSEAPAELTFYLPELKAFCGAEVVSRTMHNLYTLRGTKVRDARKWSHYIDEAINLFPNAEGYFGSHHWPLWGNEAIIDFLKKQRDGYQYIRDQTLRLAAKGYTPAEIAEELELPESLRRGFSNRGYYGTLRHNARAVYQAYFGWYDGVPAHLDPLPRVEAAQRYVAAMGGVEGVNARALEALDYTVQKLEQGEITAIEAIDSLLSEEYSTRETRRIDVALRTSKLTPIKTLESFDFSFQPSLDRERIAALAQLDFIRRAEIVHFLGPPGTGKSHLATALGVAAVKAGMQV